MLALCNCNGPNPDCRRAGQPMVGRLWQLCAGVGCTPAESAAYRQCWDERSAPARRFALCLHLGPDTGERRRCPGCLGHVEMKIFQCLHPSHASEPTTTLPACRQCPDHTEPQP